MVLMPQPPPPPPLPSCHRPSSTSRASSANTKQEILVPHSHGVDKYYNSIFNFFFLFERHFYVKTQTKTTGKRVCDRFDQNGLFQRNKAFGWIRKYWKTPLHPINNNFNLVPKVAANSVCDLLILWFENSIVSRDETNRNIYIDSSKNNYWAKGKK